MDDTATPTQQPATTQETVSLQTNTPVVTHHPAPAAQTPSISGHKEYAPITTTVDVAPGASVETAERTPVITPELKDLGVEHGPDGESAQLEQRVNQIMSSQQAAPKPPVTPTQTIAVPMTQEQALKELKKESVNNAAKWVAALVIYYLKKIHSIVKE